MNKYRIGTDIPFRVQITEGENAFDWADITVKQVAMYSDSRQAFAGACTHEVNGDDSTWLDCVYPASVQVLTGALRLVVIFEMDGRALTYDLADVFALVGESAEADSDGDTVTDANITVSGLPISVISEILNACIAATAAANDSVIEEIAYTPSTADGGDNILTIKQAGSAAQSFTIKNGSKGSTGDTGAAGADGVGIASVVQTTTSTESGGTNVITVTKTDGTSSTFQVKNGAQGEPGPQGNDEDIDQNEDGKLQFANRVYNAQQPNGMGYVILRKNKTFAEQVTDTNTIYEIRYDFDLNGASVTIPNGCVLKFNGGILNNGTLVGQNTSISAEPLTIFDQISIGGSWNVPESSLEWFGVKGDGISDCANAILACAKISGAIRLGYGSYLVNSIVLPEGLSLYGVDRHGSVVLTNGITLSKENTVSQFTVKPISAQSPYLIRVTQSSSHYLRSSISKLTLIGVADNTSDLVGVFFDAEADAVMSGFYGVNVEDVYFNLNFKNAFLFFASSSSTAWMTYIQINNVFIQKAIYPIEFEVANPSASFRNFQCISFVNVSAQYNQSVTLSFVRLANCSNVNFYSCDLVDVIATIPSFYFKDNLSSNIQVTNPRRDIRQLYGSASNEDYLSIIGKYVIGVSWGAAPSVSRQDIVFPSAPLSNNTPSLANAPTLSQFSPCYDISNKFIGFKVTNNNSMSSQRQECLFGVRNGHMSHSMMTAPGDSYVLGDVYSTAYMPTMSNAFPTGYYARGAFVYHTKLSSLVYYDSYNGYWTDALGVRISTNITARRGTTAVRTGMTMYNYNNGFLFYDTDLKKYVLWNGTAWVNMDGSAL